MAVKNLEYNVYDRVITQLRGINGTGNYNFKFLTRDIHTQYILPDQMTSDQNICIGNIELSASEYLGRNTFETDLVITVHGYIRDAKDPDGQALKLLSDLRLALAGDPFLNNLVTDFSYRADVGAMDNLGIVDFIMSGEVAYNYEE